MQDEQLEQMVGNLLRAGVILTATIVIVGGVLYLVPHAGDIPQDHLFHSEPPQFRTLRGLLQWQTLGSSLGVIELGIVLLILTPVARVALSLYGFLRERDWMYVAFTVIVLGVLCFSLAD